MTSMTERFQQAHQRHTGLRISAGLMGVVCPGTTEVIRTDDRARFGRRDDRARMRRRRTH